MINSLSLVAFLLFQAQSAAAARDWDSTRGIAEAEYEILMMAIDSQDWAKVPAKATYLFNLPFPPEHEHLKVEAAREYVDKLIHAMRTDLAHAVIDAAIHGVRTPAQQADLFREKGFICQKEGDEDCAMKCFEKSIDLEGKGHP